MNTQNMEKLFKTIAILNGYQIQGTIIFEKYFETNAKDNLSTRESKRHKQSQHFEGFRSRIAQVTTSKRDQSSSSRARNSKAEASFYTNRRATPRMVIGDAEKGAAMVYCTYKSISGSNEGDFKDFEKVMGRFSREKRPLASLKSAMRTINLKTGKETREKFIQAFEQSPNFGHYQNYIQREQEGNSQDVDDEHTPDTDESESSEEDLSE